MSFLSPVSLEQKILTSDYSISTLDPYSVFLINSLQSITIDLPPAANSYGKEYFFKQLTNRRATIDGDGSETIDGDLTVFLSGQYSSLKISCDGSNWIIKSYKDFIDSGWINRSLWANKHLGTCEVNYDNLSGTPIIGETVTCSGGIAPTGIIYDIVDLGGGTGTLKLLWVTNGGVFGDNLTLTFAVSGATALVNESTYNKNVDTDIFHGYSRNTVDIEKFFNISIDGTNSTIQSLVHADISGTASGLTWKQIDSNNSRLQTESTSSYVLIDDSGTGTVLNTQDYFYKIKFKISIIKS